MDTEKVLMESDGKQEWKKEVLKYIARVTAQRILGLACFLPTVGILPNARGGIYYPLYFVISVITPTITFFNKLKY